jgi:predicted RNA-binding protein
VVTDQGLTRGSIKGLWSAEEDAIIKRCVESGVGKWSVIAEHVPGRNGKQCRERYENHLKPTVKKGGWSEEEETKLQELHDKFGNRWSLISKHLPGRYVVWLCLPFYVAARHA